MSRSFFRKCPKGLENGTFLRCIQMPLYVHQIFLGPIQGLFLFLYLCQLFFYNMLQIGRVNGRTLQM